MIINEYKAFEPLVAVDDLLPMLDQISIFGGLTEPQLYKVLKRLKRVHYARQELIFRQGDQPSNIYIVISGRVRLVFDIDKHPLSKGEFGPGACFGETAVIGIQSHSVSTLAVEPTELMVLSKEALMSLFEEEVEVFSRLILNIAREASRRLHKTDELLLHYIHDHDQ